MKTSASKHSQELSKLYEKAVKLYESGDYEQSAKILLQVLESKPREIGPYGVCAAALSQLGRAAEAAEVLEKGLLQEPENVELHIRKMNALFLAGNVQGALSSAEASMEALPDNDKIMLAYGMVCSKAGPKHYKSGARALEKILERDPENVEALNALGATFAAAGHHREASKYFINLLRVKPDHIVALLNLAGGFKQMGELEMALNFYDRVLDIDPNEGLALGAKASILCNLGLSAENIGLLEKGLESLQNKGDAENYIVYSSNYIFYMHYVPEFPRQKIFDFIRSWHEKTCAHIQEQPRSDFQNPIDLDRKLRIGIISNSFKRHPATWMTISAIENLNKDKYEIYLYSDIVQNKRDDVTHRYYGLCEQVNEVKGVSNQELVQKMRCDDLDILLELTGHSEGGRRLPITAARVAPVQVKWVGGLFDTTGVPQMDWIIADEVQIPEGDDKWYTERVYRMPDDYVVYEPAHYVEDVQPLPALKNGYITFGNLNNLCKTNTYTISLWSKILKAVPKSRLLMKVQNMDTPFAKKHVEEEFAKNGIGVDRLILEGGEPHKAFMEAHSRCDIALDPHPYTGGLTTCEALWMGVPVITLPGETFAGRHAATHLHNAGLPDWIAKDEQDYIDIAVKWANDIEGLAKLRAGLREQVANSPLTDGPKFAKNFEKALRFMWKDWCDEKTAHDAKNKTTKKDKK